MGDGDGRIMFIQFLPLRIRGGKRWKKESAPRGLFVPMEESWKGTSTQEQARNCSKGVKQKDRSLS